MTTRKQIRELFALLSERHPDLVIAADVLVLKPVHHFAMAIIIDRTSSAGRFRPQTSSTHLFCDLERFPPGTGEWLYRSKSGPNRLWLWSDPSMPDEFVRIVERDVLPQLRAVRTLDDYHKYAESIHREHFPYYYGFRLRLCVALGRLDEARQILNHAHAENTVRPYNHYSPGLGDRLKARGSEISFEDRALLAEALHEWEAQSVANLKLASVWQRTQFPLELQSAAS